MREYFKAFLALHRKRQVAFSQLPILGTEIAVYIDIHNLEDDKEFFYRVISELDIEYLKYQSEQAEAEAKSKPEPSHRKSPTRGRRK